VDAEHRDQAGTASMAHALGHDEEHRRTGNREQREGRGDKQRKVRSVRHALTVPTPGYEWALRP
jgi:hypothetical protein